MLVILEGLVLSFWLLLVCVVGIAKDGPVGHTKAWIIPGTEEFIPYIYGKTLIVKWCGTLIGFPVLAALIAGIMQLII